MYRRFISPSFFEDDPFFTTALRNFRSYTPLSLGFDDPFFQENPEEKMITTDPYETFNQFFRENTINAEEKAFF